MKQKLGELDHEDLLDLPDELEDFMSQALVDADPDLELATRAYQTLFESESTEPSV